MPPTCLRRREVSTSVVLNSAVQRGINERLAAFRRNDNIVLSEHMQDRKRLRQREVVREVGVLGFRLESTDGNDDWETSVASSQEPSVYGTGSHACTHTWVSAALPGN